MIGETMVNFKEQISKFKSGVSNIVVLIIGVIVGGFVFGHVKSALSKPSRLELIIGLVIESIFSFVISVSLFFLSTTLFELLLSGAISGILFSVFILPTILVLKRGEYKEE